jgi:hypothetical protein
MLFGLKRRFLLLQFTNLQLRLTQRIVFFLRHGARCDQEHAQRGNRQAAPRAGCINHQ